VRPCATTKEERRKEGRQVKEKQNSINAGKDVE
jgi:hypothetical protein